MTEQPAKAEIKVRQVKSGPQAYIDLPTRKGSQPAVLSAAKLSNELTALFGKSPAELAGKQVEYRVEKGQVARVWEVGKQWDKQEGSRPTPSDRGGRADRRHDARGGRGRSGSGGHGGGSHGHQSGSRREAESRNTGDAGKFENPYNFIPAPPRNPKHASLGDGEPAGHQRYQPGHWSGRMRIALTTKTPLMVPELRAEQDNGHKVFDLRVDSEGRPVLPPTSIKGPLRAAYEAVTNSRMGVFADHDEPLALRHPAQSGAAVIPARVSEDGEYLEVLNGTTPLTRDGEPVQGEPQCAAWLPRYATKGLLRRGAETVSHGARVWARIQLWEHYRKRWNRRTNRDEWRRDFRFWRVLELAPNAAAAPQDSPGVEPERPRQEPRDGRQRTYSSPIDQRTRWVRGWIMANGLNITRKHDERLFFDESSGTAPERLPLTAEMRSAWGTLIASYREANERELARGDAAPSALPKNKGYEFSRHIRNANKRSKDNRLEPGALCYAALHGDRNQRRVTALYPVMISRDLYSMAPAALLPEHAGPPTALSQLSPADRVFGWVNQQGNGSFKGQLRIGAVTCLDGAEAIERFDPAQGTPLAILGQPKPAQARFYAARNPEGEPLREGVEKKSAYAEGGGLRGRKVYPHQAQAELSEYWRPAEDVTQPLTQRLNGRKVYREWQSHGGERSDQNRSLTGWIKPGSRFEFDLDLVNLTDVELGALLWLLKEFAQGHLRIGGGKPLGFGSARLRTIDLDLRDGEALAEDYRAFGAPADRGRRIADATQAGGVIEAYQAALVSALGSAAGGFDRLNIIKAFRHAATRGVLPTRYPRTDEQHGPVGDSFKWFVKNEAADGMRREHHSLPSLDAVDRGLPTLIENLPR